MYTLTQKIHFIESVFGKGILSGNSVNFSVRCPICAPAEASKKKLAIRVTDDAHHCWTCGWKSYSLAPLIKKYGTRDQLDQYRTFFKREEKNQADKEEKNNSVSLPSDFTLLVESPISNPDIKAVWNFLKSRNVTAKDAWYFKLGVSNEPQWKRRVICPSFDDTGALNMYVARNIDKFDKRNKYENPDIDKTSIIFNEINIDWTKPLVICEGIFDLMKCPENSTALLSSDFDFNSRLFSLIALNNTPVVLALDSDMKNKKTPRISKKFQFFDIDVKVADFGTWKDPGETTKQECKSIIKSAKSISWEENFFSKLDFSTRTSLTIKV